MWGGGCTATVTESALKADWEKDPLPHLGLEPASVLRLAFQLDALSRWLLVVTLKFPKSTSTFFSRRKQSPFCPSDSLILSRPENNLFWFHGTRLGETGRSYDLYFPPIVRMRNYGHRRQSTLCPCNQPRKRTYIPTPREPRDGAAVSRLYRDVLAVSAPLTIVLGMTRFSSSPGGGRGKSVGRAELDRG